MKKLLNNGLLALAVLALAAPLAHATILLPGDSAPSSAFAVPTADLTLLATTGPEAITASTYTGILTAAVYLDTSPSADRDGIVCPAAGCLDFVYQFQYTGGTTKVARETNSIFTAGEIPCPVPTSCEFATGAQVTNTVSSLPGGSPFQNGVNNIVLPFGVTATRDVSGETVGFDFGTTPAQFIGAGQVSPILIILTDATVWVPGFSDTIDGGIGQVPTYQPGTGVPEPASMLLIGTGLVGLAALRRRKKSSTR